MKYFLLFGLLCNIFLFNSCKKYEAAPAAFFIKSSPVSVATTGTAQGTSSNKITDLYLYINGKFQGAFQEGNTLPIPTYNKNVSIDVFAGIKNNGIKSLSITWIFYDKISFDTLVESGKTINRPMTFKYNPNTKFLWMENFEGNGFSIVKSTDYNGDTAASFKVAQPFDTFEGSKSVELSLPGNHSIGVLESSIPYALPKANSNVYLELNYKCDSPFEVGVIGDWVSPKTALNINAQPNWNKIYIQLADAINRSPAPDQQKIYFRVVKTNDFPDPHVWLDNIKLIYL